MRHELIFQKRRRRLAGAVIGLLVVAAAMPVEATPTRPAATTEAAPDETLRAVQAKLRTWGYSTKATGLMDSITGRSISHVQRASGLTVTGTVTDELVSALRSTPKVPAVRLEPPAPDPAPVAASYKHPHPDVERWHSTALAAGWPESQWKRLSCVIRRESLGQPRAHNPRDPGYGSYGLAQLNMSKGKSGTWALYSPRLGGDITALYDPLTNLTIARDLYLRAQRMWANGWKPWGACS